MKPGHSKTPPQPPGVIEAPRTDSDLLLDATIQNEEKLRDAMVKLAPELRPGDRIFFEGPMGAGKSTAIRHLLSALGAAEGAQAGSPSFALAHEYETALGRSVHIDFYRIENEEEAEAAGLGAYLWEEPVLVFCEWTSRVRGYWKNLRNQATAAGKGEGTVAGAAATGRRESTVAGAATNLTTKPATNPAASRRNLFIYLDFIEKTPGTGASAATKHLARDPATTRKLCVFGSADQDWKISPHILDK